jgi:Lon protease-like protein
MKPRAWRLNTRDSQSGHVRLDLPTKNLPLVNLEGVTLFPGTLLPLHAWDEQTCRQLSACLTSDRLLVVHGGTLGRLTQSQDHPAVAGLGRAVSDRRYPDGRIDLFLHGLARVELNQVTVGPHGLFTDVTLAPDLAPDPPERAHGLLLRLTSMALLYARGAPPEESDLIASVLKSSVDPVLVSNRLAAAFITAPDERHILLTERCPANRCERLLDLFATRLLAANDAPSADLLH